MIKKKASLAFICIFLVVITIFPTYSVVAASSEPTLEIVDEGLVGWENWKPKNFIYGDNNYYRLYCPYEGATIDDIFYFINKVVSENMGILSERYGDSLYNHTSVHLMFDWPDLGENPVQGYSELAKYLYSTRTFYNEMPIEFMMWDNTGLSQKDKGVAKIEIALSNNESTSWANYKYNPLTGAYEITYVEFYDELSEILEYKKFETRTGSWVQNGWILYSWSMYSLRNLSIVRSNFEIFDADSFDKTILNQPYTEINMVKPGKIDGNYVLVKHLSLVPIEPAVREKVSDLCEKAKKSSSSQTGQLKYINDYFCKNVKYDYDFYKWILSDQRTPYNSNDGIDFIEWMILSDQRIPYDSKNGVVPNNAYGALVDGLAICSGFSHAIAEICDYLGIPNFYIDNETHIWNVLYIDNQWKMLDVTWNATGDNTSAYFLVDNITEPSGSHKYDSAKIEAEKKDTLAYWNLKNKYAKYLEYNTDHQQIVSKLVDVGIFVGNDNGELNLHKGLTRAELATLLTRLRGQENQVKKDSQYYTSVYSFDDVPTWAAPYVGYCYEQGLLKGYSDSSFGSNDAVNIKMACTVILRYLGYAETDWGYDTSVDKIKSIGIMPDRWPTGTTALRNDIAIMVNYVLGNTPSP